MPQLIPVGPRPGKHLLLLCSIALVVTSIRIVFQPYYVREYNQLAAGSNDRAPNEVAHWQVLSYFTSEKTNLADLVSSRVDWASLGLTDVQEQALKIRLPEVIRYFEEPTLDRYYRLKTEGLYFCFHSGPFMHSASQSAISTNSSPEIRLAQEYDIVASHWHREYGTNAPARITGISLEGMVFTAGSVDTLPVLSKGTSPTLAGLKKWRHDLGEQRHPPVGAAHELPRFFGAAFFVRTSPGGSAGPLYFSLTWSEPDQQWAPWLLGAHNCLRFFNLF